MTIDEYAEMRARERSIEEVIKAYRAAGIPDEQLADYLTERFHLSADDEFTLLTNRVGQRDNHSLNPVLEEP